MDVVAVAAAAAFISVELGALTGVVGFQPGPLILVAPFVVSALALIRRQPLTSIQAISLGAASLVAAAIFVSVVITFGWLTAAAIPVMAAAAVVCGRFPAQALIALVVMTGAFGSLQAFLGFPAPRLVDVLLGGLWLSAAWGWLVRGRGAEHPAWLWPVVGLVLAYVAFSAVGVLVADNTVAALQSFRASTWYLSVVLLLALAPWPAAVRRTVLRGAVLVAGAVGAYATFRWLAGPAGAEQELAARSLNNYLGQSLRPVGSFYTAKELAAWMAIAVPFLAGLGLAWRGGWRAAAISACAVCVVAMLAADVRAGPAAAAPGVVVVLVLFQLAQAFRGQRGPAVLVAAALAVVGGTAAFAATVGGEADSGRRYSAILDPESDPSYQGRLIKWRTALDDIHRVPLGHGLGTSGRAQKRYGTFVNIGSVDVDNSYLKVAYEQGFLVMLCYAGALLLVLGGLARRSVTTADPARAGPALAACGTLTAMLVLFWIGNYVEGLPALAGWTLVGLGVSQFTVRSLSDGERPR